MTQIKFDAELLLRSINKANRCSEIVKILEYASSKIRDFTQTGPSVFSIYGFEFKAGEDPLIHTEQENLRIASELSVRSVPKEVYYREFDDNQLVLVSFFPGCTFRKPASCHSNYPFISDAAKSLFVSDLDKLARAGLYHPGACTSYSDWYLHPDGSQILLTGWEMLRAIEKREQVHMVTKIPQLFQQYDEARNREMRGVVSG